MSNEITLSEVSKHNNKNSVWMVIHNNVYDVTQFLDEHPGGEDALLEAAGQDSTRAFEDVGHSEDARELLKKYRIGDLAESDQKNSDFLKRLEVMMTHCSTTCPGPDKCRYGSRSLCDKSYEYDRRSERDGTTVSNRGGSGGTRDATAGTRDESGGTRGGVGTRYESGGARDGGVGTRYESGGTRDDDVGTRDGYGRPTVIGTRGFSGTESFGGTKGGSGGLRSSSGGPRSGSGGTKGGGNTKGGGAVRIAGGRLKNASEWYGTSGSGYGHSVYSELNTYSGHDGQSWNMSNPDGEEDRLPKSINQLIEEATKKESQREETKKIPKRVGSIGVPHDYRTLFTGVGVALVVAFLLCKYAGKK